VPSALVLTAGLGTRLDPLTRLVAKPAIPLGHATLIERILRWLAAEGVDDVVLNLHHQPATIAAVVGDGSHLGLRVRYSWEARLLGSAGGPRHALPLLSSDPFLIVNGDVLCEMPVAPLLETHRTSGAEVTMAVTSNPAPDRYSGLALGVDDLVVGVVPRGQPHGSWHFVGVQVARPGVFLDLPDGVPAETVSGLYGTLMQTRPRAIRAHRTHARFLDVGTPRDYLHAALSLEPDTPSSIAAGARIDDAARLERCVVWPEAVVHADVALDECIVAGAVEVPARTNARRTILVPAGLVREGDVATVKGGVAHFPLEGLAGGDGRGRRP
jgi:NDP-sugar pyrophosphorylase family protein